MFTLGWPLMVERLEAASGVKFSKRVHRKLFVALFETDIVSLDSKHD